MRVVFWTAIWNSYLLEFTKGGNMPKPAAPKKNSTLRYTVSVSFDIDAGDTDSLKTRLEGLEHFGKVTGVWAKTVRLDQNG